MTILQISDTHNRHQLLTNLPTADVLVHCGDFTDMGTEEEALNFLNWLIEQPYRHKIFVTGNHDLCLWEAENIEDLSNNYCCPVNFQTAQESSPKPFRIGLRGFIFKKQAPNQIMMVLVVGI